MQTQLTIRIRAILLLSFHVLHAIWAATSSGAQHTRLAHGRQHTVPISDPENKGGGALEYAAIIFIG